MNSKDNSKARVLIVDDDPAVRDAISLWLDCNGYISSCFDDANDFIDQYSPDLRGCIVADIRMPGMSGLELLKHIKEKYDKPPPVVMMITAYGDDENYNQAMKLGADDFLTKPVDFVRLKEKLKTRNI